MTVDNGRREVGIDGIIEGLAELRLEIQRDTGYQSLGLAQYNRRLRTVQRQSHGVIRRVEQYATDIQKSVTEAVRDHLVGDGEQEHYLVREYYGVKLGKLLVRLPKPFRTKKPKEYTVEDVKEALARNLQYTRELSSTVKELRAFQEATYGKLDDFRNQDGKRLKLCLDQESEARKWHKDLSDRDSELEQRIRSMPESRVKTLTEYALRSVQVLRHQADFKVIEAEHRYELASRTAEQLYLFLEYISRDVHELRLAEDYLDSLAANFEALALWITKAEPVLTTLHKVELHKMQSEHTVDGVRSIRQSIGDHTVLDPTRESDSFHHQLETVLSSVPENGE